MKTVVIASKSAAKLAAAQIGFKNMFPAESFSFESVAAPSGVADQPRSDQETYTGARNRLAHVVAAQPDADYWMSFEGGVEEDERGMAVFAWALVRDKSGRTGSAKTSLFYLPEKVAALVREGMELSAANDQVFGSTNSKDMNGVSGLFTNGAVARAAYYGEAATLALVPLLHAELYS